MAMLQLIDGGPGSGTWNMAADEWLLREAERLRTPLLRVYTWSEPTLSLGYFQAAAERESHAASASCTWVRRASGGGAILHHHETTYALAVPTDTKRGFAQPLYDLVHEALVDELRDRQIGASRFAAADASPSRDRAAVSDRAAEPFLCFARRAPGDVVLNNVKILGSAQRRSATAILQHGSLLFKRSSFAPELPGLCDLVERPFSEEDLVAKWLDRIAASMGLQFEPRHLVERDCQQINCHASGKFGTQRWALRR